MVSVPKPKHDGNIQERLFQIMVRCHIFVYRLTGGIIGHRSGATQMLLLTTKGRKSGQARTQPVMYVDTAQGYAVVASFAGSDRHPAWYLNLTATPDVTIQVGSKRTRATAETIPDGNHYADIWQRVVEMYPDFALYKERTERHIPIVQLAPERSAKD